MTTLSLSRPNAASASYNLSSVLFTMATETIPVSVWKNLCRLVTVPYIILIALSTLIAMGEPL